MMRPFKKDHGGREKYFPVQYKKDLADDCVIRAVAIGTGLDYMKVWHDLFALGTKLGHMPSSDMTSQNYLDGLGWTRHRFLKAPGGGKIQVMEFPLSDAIIRTCRHMTVIAGGIHRDTWNCGHSKANTYWTPPHNTNQGRPGLGDNH